MDARRLAAVIIAVIGILAVIAGIVYMLVPAESLPSFFPGHIVGAHAKHSTRGAAALVFGVVLVGIGVAVGYRRRSLYPH